MCPVCGGNTFRNYWGPGNADTQCVGCGTVGIFNPCTFVFIPDSSQTLEIVCTIEPVEIKIDPNAPGFTVRNEWGPEYRKLEYWRDN
jgi:hypothetical protein